jgi:hypothetical protein
MSLAMMRIGKKSLKLEHNCTVFFKRPSFSDLPMLPEGSSNSFYSYKMSKIGIIILTTLNSHTFHIGFN